MRQMLSLACALLALSGQEALSQVMPPAADRPLSVHRLQGGNLGRLVGAPTPQTVTAAIENLADVIYVPDRLDLQIGHVMRLRSENNLQQGTLVRFNQVINGIPVFAFSELVCDAEGTIVELTTQFVDPARVSHRPVIPQTQALKAAIRRIEFEIGSYGVEYELERPATLQYQVDGTGPQLVPFYTFNLRAPPAGTIIGVSVNGNSGKAIVIVNPTAALTQGASVRLATRIP